MPTIKNEKGEIVASMPYTTLGQEEADDLIKENPGWILNLQTHKIIGVE